MFPLPLAAGTIYFGLREAPRNWHSADWSSAGIAPDPKRNKEAIVQIYAARTGRWKSIFAVHCWIALKREGAQSFTRYDVVGWGAPVRRNAYPVDGKWYSNEPAIVYDLRGASAARLIPKIEAAIATYSFRQRGDYRIWPGPNSNTFVASIARRVEGFDPVLPATAMGKDFLGPGIGIDRTPSKSGYQISLYGAIGMTIAAQEGVELNLFGLTAGLTPASVELVLPSFGRVGPGQLEHFPFMWTHISEKELLQNQ